MKTVIYNKKARFNYELLDQYEAGIVLTGSEIKSIRAGRVQISESHGIIRNNEIFVLNMNIATFKQANMQNHDPLRTRKLLLKRSQINKIIRQKKSDKITLVPTKLYIKDGFAKLQIFTAKGKKQHDKREAIKQRDESRRAKGIEKYR